VSSDKAWNPDTILDVLGCPTARRVLALGAVQPCSAEQLTAHCDASKPTVYRRLNVLDEYDLLVERCAVDDDGTHYKTYETALEEVTVSVESEAFAVDIELTRDIVDATAEAGLDDHRLTEDIDAT
jgi:predicted transcriptional regulator